MKKILALLFITTLAFALHSCDSEDYSNGYENGYDNGYENGGEPQPPIIPITGVTLSPTSQTLAVGDTLSLLTATISPANATNRAIAWSSNDSTIVTVSDNNGVGFLTAISSGTATITVTTEDGDFTATSEIEVYEILPNFCNTRTPGWGATLGTISWGTIGNTDIESGTTTIIGTDDRPSQVWSGAVFASACANKTTFNGGTIDWNYFVNNSFNADCRRAHTELTGHFFSWCAVVRFADQLCPYPWRVPTFQDFEDLDLNLGGTGTARSGDRYESSLIAEQLQWFIPAEGTAASPQIGGLWGGARFTGFAGNPTINMSFYWSQSKNDELHAFCLAIETDAILPNRFNMKHGGAVVRCVR